jgi:hypothetical protein
MHTHTRQLSAESLLSEVKLTVEPDEVSKACACSDAIFH